MKDRAVVSDRGTITIPQTVRETADIHPGDLIEFKPEKDRIILRHLIVKRSSEEKFMSNSDWDKFDRLVHSQLKKGQYSRYRDLGKAKLHSRGLLKNNPR